MSANPSDLMMVPNSSSMDKVAAAAVAVASGVLQSGNSITTSVNDNGNSPFYINGVREDCIRWVVTDEITGKQEPKILITRGCRSCPIEFCDNRNLNQDGRTVIKHYKSVHEADYGELLSSNYDKGPKLLVKKEGRITLKDDDGSLNQKSENDIINEIRRIRDKERRMRNKDSISSFAKKIRNYMDIRPQRVVKIICEFLKWGPAKSLHYIMTQWKEFRYRVRNFMNPVEIELVRHSLPFNIALLLTPGIAPDMKTFPDNNVNTMISKVINSNNLAWNSIYWPVNSLSSVLNGCIVWEYLTDNSNNQLILPPYHPSEELKKFNFRTNKKFSLWKRDYQPQLNQIPGFKYIEDRMEESNVRYSEVDELVYDEIIMNMKTISDSLIHFPINKRILWKYGYNILPCLKDQSLAEFKINQEEYANILRECNMIDPRLITNWVEGKDETNAIAPPPQWCSKRHKLDKQLDEPSSPSKKRKLTDFESRIDTQLLSSYK